jgi:hypothetical protein
MNDEFCQDCSYRKSKTVKHEWDSVFDYSTFVCSCIDSDHYGAETAWNDHCSMFKC